MSLRAEKQPRAPAAVRPPFARPAPNLIVVGRERVQQIIVRALRDQVAEMDRSIAPDDSSGDLFVHHSAISMNGHKTLTEGQRVEYTREEAEKGLRAADVRSVD